MLVAVFMLFVVGGMAALSIDAVTIYTARSEAQLAADGAALAAARMLANSGMTSNAAGLTAAAETLASAVAIQVAQNSLVGGRYLVATNGEVTVSFAGTTTNPKVTVRTQRTDLPTFFARIWGSRQITVAASATAEAYNPSGAVSVSTSSAPPVAPICVKPWLLPNLDPTSSTSGTIFGTDGSITNPSLLGWSSGTPMSSACGTAGTCTLPLNTATPWNYYPGDQTSFPAPTTALPLCSLVPAPTLYQESIAGCVQLPISCNTTTAYVDMTAYGATRNGDTADAVNCLAHTTNNNGDTVASTAPPTAPFQFVVGSDNPVAVANPALVLSDVVVSDSLVTVPVFNSIPSVAPTSPVTLMGFVQLFLQPNGSVALDTGPTSGNINTTIVNMVGCGTNVSGPPILGNGASPVAVRLISP